MVASTVRDSQFFKTIFQIFKYLAPKNRAPKLCLMLSYISLVQKKMCSISTFCILQNVHIYIVYVHVVIHYIFELKCTNV